MRNTDPVWQTGDRPASEEAGRHDLPAAIAPHHRPGAARHSAEPAPCGCPAADGAAKALMFATGCSTMWPRRSLVRTRAPTLMRGPHKRARTRRIPTLDNFSPRLRPRPA